MKAKFVLLTKVGKNRFLDSFSSLISCLAGSESSEGSEMNNQNQIQNKPIEMPKSNPEMQDLSELIVAQHEQELASSIQEHGMDE